MFKDSFAVFFKIRCLIDRTLLIRDILAKNEYEQQEAV